LSYTRLICCIHSTAADVTLNFEQLRNLKCNFSWRTHLEYFSAATRAQLDNGVRYFTVTP